MFLIIADSKVVTVDRFRQLDAIKESRNSETLSLFKDENSFLSEKKLSRKKKKNKAG